MKKKWAVAGCTILVIVLAALFWLASPKVFLKEIDPMDVSQIQVFDGNTGESFFITDMESITHIVETVQRVKMKRTGLSIGYMGYRFRLEFLDKNGKRLSRFILNSATVIRQDPFFYETSKKEEEDPLCYMYFEQIETEGEEKSFLAEIMEIQEGSLLVRPLPDTYEARSSDAIVVSIQSMPLSPEPMVGSIVSITYSGGIQESHPAGLDKVISIEVAEVPCDVIPEDTESSAVLKAMIMVNGKLYVDTGEISTEARCGVMDGNIDSAVPVDQKPVQDNQSNFGKDYGFQYGMEEDTIEVYMNGEWRIFKVLENREE